MINFLLHNNAFQLAVLLLISPRLTATQYASSLYNRQFYDHNSQQQVHQQQQQQERSVYPDIPVTYNQQYPAAGHSIWSTAPIVVTDEGNRLDQDRRYLPINYYNNRETDANVEADNNYYNNVPTTRAANHNYNAPGHFYYTQQQQQQERPQQQQFQPQSQQELEQRELLAVSNSQREEEQVVRIGGNHSLAPNNYNYSNNNYNHNNYFKPPQTLRRRDFEAKYAKHYSDYLRKYPQRLQPLYNTDTLYDNK